MARKTRNVYLTLPLELHLEIRALGLRSHRTVDELYQEAAILLLRKHGLETATEMGLTTEVDGVTIR